jgi:hypothetical protein
MRMNEPWRAFFAGWHRFCSRSTCPCGRSDDSAGDSFEDFGSGNANKTSPDRSNGNPQSRQNARSASAKRRPPSRPIDVMSRSGRGRLWLLGLARLGADRLSRGGGLDAERSSRGNRRRRGLGAGSEERPAFRTELRLVPDHAYLDAVDIRNVRTAKPKRIAAAGLLLLGSVGVAGRRPHRSRKCCRQRQTKLEIPGPDDKHESPKRCFNPPRNFQEFRKRCLLEL